MYLGVSSAMEIVTLSVALISLASTVVRTYTMIMICYVSKSLNSGGSRGVPGPFPSNPAVGWS